MWREARGEGPKAMIAVGCCVRNRVTRPTWWGRDYIDVITKKWQFSAMAAPGDPQLIVYPKSGDKQFEQALEAATWIIDGSTHHPMPGADSYYDISIPRPKWADGTNYVGSIGRLRFHNTDHDTEVTE